jgi:MoxR-like ATPase
MPSLGAVYHHRIILSAEARLRGHTPTDLIAQILEQQPAPVE